MAAMTELNADFGRETDNDAEVVLSKTDMQRKRTLKDIKFSDHMQSMEKIHFETSLDIRITINGELYGYDIPIPTGERIYPDKTVLDPSNDTIKVKIFKETLFSLKSAMMR